MKKMDIWEIALAVVCTMMVVIVVSGAIFIVTVVSRATYEIATGGIEAMQGNCNIEGGIKGVDK